VPRLALIAAELAANPPPQPEPQCPGCHNQTPTRNLLECLLLGKDQVLAFLDDPSIPFDNNRAKQDLRMLKVQQKVSSCLRADIDSNAIRMRLGLSLDSQQATHTPAEVSRHALRWTTASSQLRLNSHILPSVYQPHCAPRYVLGLLS
jgi:Transposase IS66 family